ncbi:YbaB/EbfC family nucleoid-associated protein [Mycobacterium sp. E796]|uniref:YbaB/EbfC family nucleoid-associated protein n=1 Tax=Mycobacterium sp. E796 TaxID=1834151 RepID=UPI0007FEEDDA|nr:YbaB/EbfC family nucleoid-associated protein [Mycobacterium sp. E796]OBI59756.1 hypothetical protein A5706_01335 [Mycobacterium sp. E796]
MNRAGHAQLDEALRQTGRMESLMDELTRRLDTESFRGTDEAKTVAATLNGRRWLTGLYIEDGLLRLGTETVAQRVNEAIRNALAAATAAGEAEQQRLAESMADIVGSLSTAIGLVQAKQE